MPAKRKGVPLKGAAEAAKRATRELEAVRLRKAGKTYRQIAEDLGVCEATAFQDVRRVLDRTRKLSNEEGEQIRAIELERLDAALESLQSRITKGEPRAIEVMLKIQERRARLLGLDAPTKVSGDVELNLAGLLALAESDEGTGDDAAPPVEE